MILKLLTQLNPFLSSNFDMKDPGPIDVILRMKLVKNYDCIILTLSHHIKKLVQKFNYFNEFLVSSPFDPSIKLMKIYK